MQEVALAEVIRQSTMQVVPLPRKSVPVQVTAVRADRCLRKPDDLASEEPMEIRLSGPGQLPEAVGVTMRTPGNDFELAVGFLITEGILRSQDAIHSVAYCQGEDPESSARSYNIVTVEAAHLVDLDAYRRLFSISSACGVCGKAALDQIERRALPVAPSNPWPLETLLSLPESLRSEQTLFSSTGGLHGAGLFDRKGTALAVREDIGRHNAVDKLVGWAGLRGRLPLEDLALVVSGRLGFEIVQKAAVVGISHVVAVSAPSSLAVELAQRMGMTILAFVRADRANIYCGEDGVGLPRQFAAKSIGKAVQG